MSIYTTELVIDSSAQDFEQVLKTVEELKRMLMESGMACSPETHSYICGDSYTLVKVLPVSMGAQRSEVGGQYPIVSIRISSSSPELLVRIDSKVVELLKANHVHFRRSS